MSLDGALQIPNSNVFTLLYFFDTIVANTQFDIDFPVHEYEHGFIWCLRSCKGVVLYWNTVSKDFGTELVALPT